MATKRDDGPREQAARAAEDVTRAVRDAADAGRDMRRAGERRQTERLHNLMSASTRAYRDVADTSKEDVDAIMQSGARLAQGMQDVGWEMMNFTQESLRCSLRAANDLLECRSVEDLVAVQRDYVKESIDILLSESAKLLLTARVCEP